MESQSKVGVKPLKVGQKLWVDIISKGKNNDGIASYGSSNFIIIIPNTEIGKRYKIQVIKVSKNVSFGEVIRNEKE